MTAVKGSTKKTVQHLNTYELCLGRSDCGIVVLQPLREKFQKGSLFCEFAYPTGFDVHLM
jgi:hypothetical protein